jgi:putative ABC transport system permease protein
MRLILLNLLRSPLRTGLTVFGTAVALTLFCLLEALINAFNAGVDMSSASRLVVTHKESLTFLLPASHLPIIRRTDGIKRAAAGTWFGGLYEEPLPGGRKREEFFAQFAVDVANYLPMYPEIVMPSGQWEALLADRRGCVIGDELARRLNKKLGDRLALRGLIWAKSDGSPWEFNVRAIYTTNTQTFDRTIMFFHDKYLDETRQFAKGLVGCFVVELADANRSAEVGAKIDGRFANSPYETKTMNEKAFNMQFVSMLGNLQLLFRFIGTVVILTMLLISANTMMMSGRERTREMAVLKALGFSDGYVFRVLIGEALAVAVLGAILGAGGAWLGINVLEWNPKRDFFPIFRVPEASLLAALGIALLTGVLSGLVPAVAGLRLKAAEALRAV